MKSTLELISQGILNMHRKHDEGEQLKLGNLRVGSSGVLAMNGEILGQCMRKAFLRQQGVPLNDVEENREHMFAGGRANEDIWIALLEAAAEPGLTFLREEEFPVEAFTSNGTRITGRPDIVLVQDGVPQKVLELKLASSLYTAIDTGINLKPKLGHVIQAVHYSHQLKLPVELWYASRADFHIPEFKKKDMPSGNSRLEYNWKGEAKKILPYLQGYSLEVQENGQVLYRSLPDGKSVHTIVTVQGLESYFEQLSLLKETDVLPGRPSKLDLDGGKQPWSACDYCVLKPVCFKGSGTSSVKEWTDEVEKFLEERAKVSREAADKNGMN